MGLWHLINQRVWRHKTHLHVVKIVGINDGCVIARTHGAAPFMKSLKEFDAEFNLEEPSAMPATIAAPVGVSFWATPESELIATTVLAISNSSWAVGQFASMWIKQFARGRTDADFGTLIGLSPDQVFQRRRVWEQFADLRGKFPSLVWSHFYAALEWDDAEECLKWANDVTANVAEMRAWRRAQHGQDLTGDE